MWFRGSALATEPMYLMSRGVFEELCIDVMGGSGTHSINVHATQCVPTKLSATRKRSHRHSDCPLTTGGRITVETS